MKKFLVIFCLLSWISFGQIQQQPRHINFNQVLVGLDGKPMVSPAGSGDLTLGEAAVNALLGSAPNDTNPTGVEKLKRYELARRIFRNSDAILSLDDITLIRDRIGIIYAPAVVGVTWAVLDPKN